MINTYLSYLSENKDSIDSITIVNCEGIVEYSAVLSGNSKELVSEGLVGKNILDIYSNLTEFTSSHFRVTKTGQSIINEKQTLIDYNGNKIDCINSTFPITSGDDIIGTFEGSKIYFNEVHNKNINENTFYKITDIIGESEIMDKIKERVLQLAVTNSSVLITGETGTGKELLAQALHYHSLRSAGPFVSVNVSAIPENLLESTLFGVSKGSFTGAIEKIGLFEKAHSGTLFLDELNSMSLAMQAKILRAIETKNIRRVGDVNQRAVDIRFVSAMNINCEEALASKQLRNDLFYRVAASQLYLPPLRERNIDIKNLIAIFLETDYEISPVAMTVMMAYHWPGNVRELKNSINYSMSVAKTNQITVQELPEYILFDNRVKKEPSIKTRRITLAQMTAAFETAEINEVLKDSRTLTEAARILGLTRQSLRYKMEKYGIQWPT